MVPATELTARADELQRRLAHCEICPHACGVNRLAGETGRCGIGSLARVASVCDHHGEEPALSGTRGSGAIFMAGCNLNCVFCQNHQISQGTPSRYPEYTATELAAAFLRLQQMGCHNVNWVSPSHVAPQLVAGLSDAVRQGFHLPLVYNSNGYDGLETLSLLEGLVDIYLPDLKYADGEAARRLSGASDYPDRALTAIRAMYRQVGDLQLDDDGIALRGVIVRHLVLPENLSGTRSALRRLAEEVSPTITVSLMAQYYPTHHASTFPALSRTITVAEYDEALDAFADAGLENGWAQEPQEAPESYRPDFSEEGHPFKGDVGCGM